MFWKRKTNKNEILDVPRAGHYILAHQAIRQICQSDPHNFFGLIASDEQQSYIQFMIDQVAENNPEDPPDFSAGDLQVTISRIGHYPMIMFTMPEPKAYTECIHIAIVLMIDGEAPNVDPSPEIKYFTLELGEAENYGEARFFCQWQGDDHLNIGEMDNNSNIGDFALAIKQRIAPD